eukprot:jgi/Mesvir1/24626/Mv21935-RA.1
MRFCMSTSNFHGIMRISGCRDVLEALSPLRLQENHGGPSQVGHGSKTLAAVGSASPANCWQPKHYLASPQAPLLFGSRGAAALSNVHQARFCSWKGNLSQSFARPADPTPSSRPRRVYVSASADLEEHVDAADARVSAPSKKKATPSPLFVTNDTGLPAVWDGPGGSVLLIDKPLGWTSFDVCGKLRSLLKVKKVGHAGTLDPLATGLLVVMLGPATKLADSYVAKAKVYAGSFKLGEHTPSFDADSEVVERLPWEHITDEDVERAKSAFMGAIQQIPPMYSAIKMKGEPLYKKARKGETVEREPRSVTITQFDTWRDPGDRQIFHFRVGCSKGTYIRSLAHDLGRALGSAAHLTALRREAIGELHVDRAWRMPELMERHKQMKTAQAVASES